MPTRPLTANSGCGAGAQYDSLVLLTLGTGIGGGIIVRDTLVDGAHSCGGECGHILVNPAKDAWQDSLGKSGSLEAYANAGAVIRRATDALGSSEASSLARRHRTGEPITPRMVAEEAERGDVLARNVVMETAHWLAIGIVTFVHTIDPDAVVLGGAMNFGGPTSPLGREFLQKIRDEVRPRLLEPLRNVGEDRICLARRRCRLHRRRGPRAARTAQAQLTSFAVHNGLRSIRMELDDELCLCFHVTKRKVINYLRIERPQRVAQLADCHGAGTGCGWCRPFLADALRRRANAGPTCPGTSRSRRLRPCPRRLRPRRQRHAAAGGDADRCAVMRIGT